MRRLTFIILMCAVLWVEVSAEEILLKDGTKVTGQLTAINGDTFHVNTAYGEIKVPRSQVVSITFSENQAKTSQATETEGAPVDESLIGASYLNHTGNFAATVPQNWVLSPSMRKTKDILAALKSADGTLFFMVTVEPFAGNLATYEVLVETQVCTKFRDCKKVKESNSSLDGRSGTRLIFQATSRELNTPFKFLVYVLPYEGRMVRLTFFTLEPLFDDAMPTFEGIAESYHSIKATTQGVGTLAKRSQ